MSTPATPDIATVVAALLLRVQALEDREAIRRLYARYGWLVDSGRWERIATEVFTEDGELILGSGMVHHGRAEIHRSYERTMPRLEGTAHYFTNVQVDVCDDETARSQAYFQSYHWTRAAAGEPMRPTEFVGVGVYHDRLTKSREGWRIAHRRRGLLGPGPLGHGKLPSSMAGGMNGWGQTHGARTSEEGT